MGRISEGIFKRSKKNTESSEGSNSNLKENRDSRIDGDHSESTAPINSDRSGSSGEPARDGQSFGFTPGNSVDSVQLAEENCTRWSFGPDINIAKMSGPGFFKTLTTQEAIDANSDDENEESVYYNTERKDGPSNAMRESSRATDEPTSPQRTSQNSVTKDGKGVKKKKSPKGKKKKAKKVDDQPSGDSPSGKQKKKKKKGKDQKSKKQHDKASADSPVSSEPKSTSSDQLAAFKRALQVSSNSTGHAPDAKKPSQSADLEKLFAFQRKMKGSDANRQVEQGEKKPPTQGYQKMAAPSKFADFFNSSIYQSVETFVRSPITKTRKGHQPENPGSPGGQQPGGRQLGADASVDASAVQSTKEIDGKQLKRIAVARIRAFTAIRRSINEQKQFLDALEDEETSDSDNDIAKDRRSKRPSKRESYQKLENELRKYESMLETERTELSKQKVNMQLEKQSVEQLLTEETRKNKSLQLRIRQLEVQVENFQDLGEKNLVLQTQVDFLQEQNAQHKEKISKMMTFQQSEVKRSSSPSLESYLTEDAIASDSKISATDLEEQSGFLSMSSMTSKAQGELLKLRSSLKHKNLVCQQQSEELVKVKQELESLKEEQGVEKLETHVKHLQDQKKFFMAEIEKLQKELTLARDELKKKPSKEANPPAPPAEFNNGQWFTFGDTGYKAEEKTDAVAAASARSDHPISQSQEDVPVLLATPRTTLSGVLNSM